MTWTLQKIIHLSQHQKEAADIFQYLCHTQTELAEDLQTPDWYHLNHDVIIKAMRRIVP